MTMISIATQSRTDIAGDVSDEPTMETVSRAVRAARDLLATLAGSTEGVSLVGILTQAVLENRGAVPVDAPATSDTASPRAPVDHEPTAVAEPVHVPPVVAEGGLETDPESIGDDDSDGLPAGFHGDESAAARERQDTVESGDDDSGSPVPPRVRFAPRRREPAHAGVDPETDEDYDMQFGMRVPASDTYYPNLPAFVERFLANVFPYHQSAVTQIKWVPDWWKYPALVFPLDAIWRAYEVARKSPGQMMIWYIQSASMMDRVFDKDRGIVASLDVGTELTASGDPLPCKRPNRAWRAPIVDRLAVPKPAGSENRHSSDSDKEE